MMGGVANGLAQRALVALAGGGQVALADLAETLQVTRKQAVNAVITLKRRGLAEAVGLGVYVLSAAGRDFIDSGRVVASGQTANGKRPRGIALGLRARAWWVMRRRGKFTLSELLHACAEGSERDAASNVGKYLRALTRAGIVRRLGRGYGNEVVYHVARDLGPKAPVWRVTAFEIFDPNGKVVFTCLERCDDHE